VNARTAAVFALLTLVGVPSATVLTGGTVSYRGALPLTAWLVLAVLLTRRWPVPALALAASTVFAFRVAELTDSGWLWPLTFSAAAVVLAGRLAWTVGITGALAVAGYGWEWAVHRGADAQALSTLGVEALWLALILAVASGYRNWRRWQAEVVQRLRQEADERQARERLRIAREVHDVVAHTLAVVGVHLNVAADAFDTAPAEARDALLLAQRVRGKAMTDLASLLGVLRTSGGGPPQEDLDGVVAQVRAAGLDVELVESGDRSTVPAAVTLTVARIVREALTNTVRHTNANRVVVTLHFGPSRTEVEVADDGQAAAAPTTSGHGHDGMRERVRALGGTFSAGPRESPAGAGFVVRATIPT
jgi:signal transduction histidine kinase